MPLISIFFLLCFVVGLLGAFFSHGVWAFYLYQLIYFLNPGDRWWSSSIPSLSYSFITAIVMIFAYLVRHQREVSSISWKEQPLSKWFLFALAMYVFMFLHALNFSAHKQSTIELAKLIIVVAIGYKLINTAERLRLAIWGYVIGCTYIGYVAYNVGRNSGNRVEGIGTVDAPDANGIAAAIVPSLMILVYYAWLGNKYVRMLSVMCAALVVNATVLINSRGAFLAAVVGGGMIISYMLFSRFQRKNQRATALMIVVLGMAGAFSLTDDAFWERMETLTEVDDGKTSGSHRIDLWLATFDIMEDYPFGVGVRGYNAVSAGYIPEELSGDGTRNKAVHSSWFQSLAELGWPGPIIFVGMLVCCYRISRKTKLFLVENRKIDEYFLMIAMEAALVSFIVAATFISRFRAEILYWLMMFIACGFNIFYLQEKKNQQAVGGREAN